MERYPLTKTEYGIYIEQTLKKDTAYNLPLTVKLPFDVDIDRLKKAILAAVWAHPYLRTGFSTDENGEVYKYIRDIPVEIKHVKTHRFDYTEFVRPFDLSKDVLFRFYIIETPEEKLLFFDLHHIIYDGSSFSILFLDINAAYMGEALKIEEFTANDLALEEKSRTASEEYRAARDYYIREFAEAEDSELYTDRSERAHRAKELAYPLKLTDSAMLRALANRIGVKLSTVFNAAFAYLLSKHTGSPRVLWSTVHNGRDERLKNTVGMFVKTYPVHAEPEDNRRLDDFLLSLDRQIKLNRENDIFSFADVCSELSIHPKVLFAYQGDMINTIDFCGAKSMVELHPGLDAKEEFEFTVRRMDGRFTVYAQYAIDMYDDAVILAMCESFDKILFDMLTAETMGDIDMLTKAQLETLDEFNRNEREYEITDMVSRFKKQVEETPDNTAVVYKDERMTYRELDDMSSRLASRLINMGIKRGDAVSVLMPRCMEFPAAALGVLKACAAYQPLDPSYPDERLNFMMKDADAKCLIADRSLITKVPDCACPVIFTDELYELAESDEIKEHPTPDDRFILLYTSGSTGIPKGVQLSHRNLNAFCDWFKSAYALGPGCRVAAYASFGFDADMMDIYPTLISGAQVHIIAEEIRLDMLAIKEYFARNRITHSFMTTQVGRQFAELFPEEKYLKYLSVGGERLVPVEPPKSYSLYNVYGPTECTVFTNYIRVDRLYERVPIGRPLPCVRQYVVDKSMRRLPIGVPGELITAGHQVGIGYLNRPEQNEKAFIKNPFSDEPGYERAYRTGDIARIMSDGRVDFIGRNDGQVKIRGFRIELSEVEEVIRRFEGIKDATVQAFDEKGGGKFIAAYVVSEERVDIESLNAFIRQNKPAYMVPAVTVQIDSIPLTQNQKVNKRALPVPERKEEEIVPPKNAVQRRIFACVSNAIGSDRFGIGTDIFSAGLTSIGAIKLNVLLSKEFDVPVSISELREYSTVEALEKLLSSKETVEEYEVLSDYPLTETQNGILVECVSNPSSTVYNIPYLFRLSEKIDLNRLKKAVETVINAHPYTKIKLFIDDDGGIRVCRDDLKAPVVELIETDKLPENLVTPFELIGGRLYRVKLFKTGDGSYLFLEFHHIICDGTSEAVIIEDINSAYSGNAIEKESYTGFEAALDEQKARAGEGLKKAKAYYDAMLNGVDHDLTPAKDAHGESPSSAGISIVSHIDVGRVASFCARNGFTVNAFFNAAFALVLAKHSYKDEALYVTVYNGRNDARLERAVTMLVKTLPVTVELSGDRLIKELILSVGDQLVNSMANDIYSFAEISRAYGINAEVMFVYQGSSFTFNTIGGEPAESIPVFPGEAKAPITISVFEKNGSAEFVCEYRSDMYTEGFIRSFVTCIEKAADEFTRKEYVREVSILDKAAKEKVDFFNMTDEPRETRTVNRLFEEQARLVPDKTAVVAEGTALTYAELNARANRIAHSLMEDGVNPDEMVGVMMPRTVDAYSMREGVMKAGGAFMPLAPDYPDDRVEYILSNSGAKRVVTTLSIKEERKALFERAGVKALSLEELLKNEDETNPDPDITPKNLCYCIYTSGSTGKPKGVMIEHHSLANFALESRFNLHNTDYIDGVSATLAFAALTFDASVMEECIALYHGRTLVMATEDEINNPAALAKLLKENKVEAMFCSPSYMSNMLDFNEVVDVLRGMKAFIVGAEAFPKPLYDNMRRLKVNGRIINAYGPTEATIAATMIELSEESITIGRPVANTKILILDRFGNELPPFVPGELTILGEGVGRGYAANEKLTKENFITIDGLPAYKSGDLARWSDDGKVIYMGRMDNQVKLRGLRIELDEIENVMNTYPSIFRSVLMVKDSETEGQYLCAYFTASEKVDTALLKAHIGKSLAKYMVPSVFVQVDTFPLTKNGKVDKKALPEPVTEKVTRTAKQPINETETKILSVFRKALGRNELGTDDDFFENGGTSLTASRVAMLALSLELPIAYKDVFEFPTAEAMAKHILEEKDVEPAEPEKPVVKVSHENALRCNINEFVDEVCETRPLGRVLLAGATGFLGAHVFRKLLERETPMIVFCRSGELDSETRLRTMTAYYFDSPMDEEISRLVKVVDADITSNELSDVLHGESFDTIINCAACVKHFAKDDLIERINVGGVKNLIKLAKTVNARFIQISTLSVAGEDIDCAFDPSFRLFENALDFGQDISNKYINSKFMAEKAVLEAIDKGLDAKIIRVGNLMGRQSDGEFQINSVTNSFIRSLKAYRALGAFPVSACDTTVDFSPIDEVAEAIIRFSLTDEKFTLFHCANAHELQMGDVIEAMNGYGFKIDVVSDAEFSELLGKMLADETKNMLVSGLLTYSTSDKRLHRYIKTDNTFSIKALYRLGYKWPITDEAYLKRVISSLDSLDFFDRDDI